MASGSKLAAKWRRGVRQTKNGLYLDFREKWLTIIKDSDLPDTRSHHAFDWREAFGNQSDEEVNGELDEYLLLKDQGTMAGMERLREVLVYRAEQVKKAQERDAIGGTFELMRADLKTTEMLEGVDKYHTFPLFEVLAMGIVNGANSAEAKAWREYEKETRGLRWYRVSHGLAVGLGMDDPELSDEQIVEDREMVGAPVIEVEAKSWFAMVNAGHLPALLNALEEGDRPIAERVETVLDALLDLGYKARVAGRYSENVMEQRSKAPPG